MYYKRFNAKLHPDEKLAFVVTARRRSLAMFKT